MKRRLLALLLGIFLLLVAVLPAPTQTADVIKEGAGNWSVERTLPAPPSEELIAGLGATDFQDRERSTRQLMAQGVKVLPELKAALAKTSNPEVVDRLDKLIYCIGVKQLLEPTRISLKLDSVSSKTLFQELARVSGYQFTIPLQAPKMNAEELLSLDVRDKPLWDVLRSFNHQTGIEVRVDDDALIMGEGSDSVTPFVAVDGPFRLTLNSIHLSYTNYFSRPKNGHFQPINYQCVTMRLESEPKLQLLNLSQIKLTCAIDNLGNNLLQATDAMDEWVRSTKGPQGGHSFTHNENFRIELERKDRTATELADLKGVAKVVVVREIRTDIAVDKLQTAAKRTIPGKTFTLEVHTAKADDKGNWLELEVTLTQNHEELYDKLERQALPARIVIENNLGQRTGIELFELPQPGFLPVPGGKAIKSHFARYKLIAKAPDGVKTSSFTRLKILDWVCIEKEIAFEFKNIPLP